MEPKAWQVASIVSLPQQSYSSFDISGTRQGFAAANFVAYSSVSAKVSVVLAPEFATTC